MASFVLVHGSWHAGWCWYKVAPRLRSMDHEVVVIDLPGHGRDRTPPGQVTMPDYVEAIGGALRATQGPAILVGHSRGGIAITAAAEVHAERIRRLVYLAAYLVPSGQNMIPLAMSDSDSLIMPNLAVDQERGWDMLDPSAFRPALYHDCSDDDVELASNLLMPEPIAPAGTKVTTTAERYGAIPRDYIELTDDFAVSPALQKRMYSETKCDRVFALDAGHSAYFSAPDQLCEVLDHLTT